MPVRQLGAVHDKRSRGATGDRVVGNACAHKRRLRGVVGARCHDNRQAAVGSCKMCEIGEIGHRRTVAPAAYDAQMRTEPVVLVHGLGSSSEHGWRASGWIDLLRDAGRRAVPIDILGHGPAPAAGAKP